MDKFINLKLILAIKLIKVLYNKMNKFFSLKL